MPDTKDLTMAEAIKEALAEELRRDPMVFLMGEDIGKPGGCYNVTSGLFDEFGPDRVMDTPISEEGYVGMAVGAAATGMRPVAEVMFCDFLTLALEQIVNQAAKLRYMTGGQAKAPLVIRTTMGAGRGSAAQHSQSLHAWMAHIPGLKVVIPSTPFDAKGLLISAIRDDNPVIFFEEKNLYKLPGPVPIQEYSIPLGVADVKREGADVTLVATARMVLFALEAAEILAKEGISAEVVDPRTLRPLDVDTIVGSVKKTTRAVVIDEGCLSYGASAEIAAVIADQAFDYLDAPVKRIGAMEVPVPAARALDIATIPTAKMVVDTVKGLFGRGE